MTGITESALEWVRDADADNTVEKGDRLEQFVYLVAVPTLYPGASEIEWLGKGIDALGSGQDRADVAFSWQGERYFVQCKNYVSPLGEGDADRYRTAFERRRNAGYTELVVVALGGFTTGAARSLLEVGATMFDFDRLSDVDIQLAEFFKLVAADRAITNPAPRSKAPLPHNAEAVAALVESTSPRNLVYRATGSGKTIVQAGVIAGTQAQRTIALVPSIELVRQQLLSYAADLPSHQFLGVFSGVLPSDIAGLAGGIKATTSTSVVADFLARSGPLVVVTTYQSVVRVIVPAAGRFTFDLAIFDEAHRTTTSNDESTFAAGLYDDWIKIARRDFYTATPRIASVELKEKIAELGEDIDVTIHSMDDPTLYGTEPSGVRLTLTQAINRRVVSPFDLLVGVVSDDGLRASLLEATDGHRKVSYYTDRFGEPGRPDTYVSITDVGQAVMFLKQLSAGQSAITYHSTVDKARKMKRLLEALAEDLGIKAVVDTVDGDSSLRRRRAAVRLLANRDPAAVHIVTNCQLFTEGVDAPALDAVCFFDPRQSTVGIGQAIGRALRYVEGKRAKVILPLFVPAGVEPEDFVRESRYGNLFSVSAALRDLDVVLTDVIVEHVDAAARIVTTGNPPAVRVFITLPTDYDHPQLVASIRGIVLRGSVRITDAEIVDLVVAFNEREGRLPEASTGDDGESWLAREVRSRFDLVPGDPT